MQDDDGSFQWVALVGVGGERNLYVTPDSHWFCSYIPASLRAFPFAVMKDQEGNGVFCLEESYFSDDSEHNRLFQDDGELDPSVAKTLDFISQCEKNRQLTIKACASLKDAGLIQSWPISVERGKNLPPQKIDGMHCINEEKLNSIDAETLASLRDQGALTLAYAQILSMAQMEQLTLRADYLAKAGNKGAPSANLANILENEDSGSLNFDAFDFDTLDSDKP